MRAFALLALTLSACAPRTEPEISAIDLDCALPFQAQTARIVAQDLVPAPKDRNEPYEFYSTADGRASYLITNPSAPAHPAIMMQRVVDGTVKTTGCPYGDKPRYDELHAYLDSLKTWRRDRN